jgi:hypothetical protein
MSEREKKDVALQPRFYQRKNIFMVTGHETDLPVIIYQ